jgi:hypothetical protein
MHEHVAAAVIGLDEAIATFSVEELDRPCIGHRENSYPVLLRRYAIGVSADRTFAAGKLGHLSG